MLVRRNALLIFQKATSILRPTCLADKGGAGKGASIGVIVAVGLFHNHSNL